MPRSPIITDLQPEQTIQRRLAEQEEAQRNRPRVSSGAPGAAGATGPEGKEGHGPGVLYRYLTNTEASDPGVGKLKFGGPLGESTVMRISETDLDGNTNIGEWLKTWDDNGATAFPHGHMLMRKRGAPGTFIIHKFGRVTTTITDNGAYLFMSEFEKIGGSATGFANNDEVYIEYFPSGPKGSTGGSGPEGAKGLPGADAGIQYLFSNSVTEADPTSGLFKLNNAKTNLTTKIFIDANDADGNNMEAYLKSWDDSTTTSPYGHLIFTDKEDANKWAIFKIVGAVTDKTGWFMVPVTFVAGSETLAVSLTLTPMTVEFSRTGDKGEAGTPGTPGTPGAAGADGGPSWTPIIDSSIEKLAGGTAYVHKTAVEGDATLRSMEGYTRGCFVIWNTTFANKGLGIGLNSDPATSEGFLDIDYMLKLTNTPTVEVREAGVKMAETSYKAGDQFAITYDGITVRYWKTSEGTTTLLREVARAVGAPLYLDSWWNHEGGQVENLHFGPMGETGAAGATGAKGRNAGFRYTFSTEAGETDPGSGKVKFNSTTEPQKAVQMRISETDADGAGIEKWLAALDDTTNTVWEGHVIMRKASSPGTYCLWLIDVKGYEDKGVWGILNIAEATSSAGTFTNGDEVYLEFYQRGDKGEKGEKGETGAAGAPEFWRDVFQASSTMPAATVTGNHMMGYTTTFPVATNSAVPMHQQWITPGDYAATGKTTKFRVRFALETNNTAPGLGTFKAQLFKLTASTGASPGLTRTLAAKGTATPEIVAPSKELPGSSKESEAFELTESGVYLPVIILAGANTAAGSVVGVHVRCQVKNF